MNDYFHENFSNHNLSYFRAPKSTESYHAMNACKTMISNHKGVQPGVPLHLRNAPTKLMASLNYGRGYNTLHKDESGLSYLPEGMEDADFFSNF